MNDVPERDLEQFLQASPVVCDERLRQALLRETTGLLRRRHRRRRLALVAALAACYLAGLATMRLWPAPRSADAPQAAQQPPAPLPQPVPEPKVAVAEEPPRLPAPVLEQLGELASREKQADFFRLAGARHVAEGGDLQAALRCYRQSLDAGSEEDLAVKPEDDWLLMALKDARKKEKQHAKNDG